MIYVILGIMLCAAALVVVLPILRAEGRASLKSAAPVIVVVGLAASMYAYIGSPDVDPQQAAAPDIDAMVTSLAQRLEENPGDLAGWKMLGRSYVQLKNFSGAVAAFENAVEIESGKNAQTLSDLGEAVLMGDASSINSRAGQLFESALAIEPGNPKALFYAGLAALERGDNDEAADRWEALLATSPPPNIEAILRERVAELRGTAAAPSITTPGPTVMANIRLGSDAAGADIPDATIFIIARDPQQPSPPIAAIRRRVSELPLEITLSDADAMIPGRVPSGFAKLEIVARISMSGQPIAQAGDWFGEAVVDTPMSEPVQIAIDQQVP